MIIKYFDEIMLLDLIAMYYQWGLRYTINDGKIVGVEEIPAADRKSEQG